LNLTANNFPGIIKTIEIQKWSKIQFLNLGLNNITSIEGLAFIEMPQIKEINFEDNHVTQLKPLHKLQWKKVSGLFIAQNPFL
jgi:hypothetical protein